MKSVEDINYLEGKTIKSATQVDFGESLAIIFTDDTYAFLDIVSLGGCKEIYLNINPDDKIKIDVGIITEEEYSDIIEAKDIARSEKQKREELKLLERLKLKYEMPCKESFYKPVR